MKLQENVEKRKVEQTIVFSKDIEFIVYSMDVRIPHSMQIGENTILY